MLNAPKTLEEARAYRYNVWAGNPEGTPYQDGECAWEVHLNWSSYQCTRKNGHGQNGLYCKQHAKKIKGE